MTCGTSLRMSARWLSVDDDQCNRLRLPNLVQRLPEFMSTHSALHKAALKYIRKLPDQWIGCQNMRWRQRWTAKIRRQGSYNPDWSCPIPPKENRLTMPIRAGESTLAWSWWTRYARRPVGRAFIPAAAV
jgi:Protein of unknown function (DUF1684)